MAWLPVSGETYFTDFAFDTVNYTVERFGKTLGTVKTLSNTKDGKRYLHVLYGSDIQAGDILRGPNGRVRVLDVEVDTYNGAPSLLKLFI